MLVWRALLVLITKPEITYYNHTLSLVHLR